MYEMSFEYMGQKVVLSEMDEFSKQNIQKMLPELRRKNGTMNAVHISGVKRQYRGQHIKNVKFKKL